MVSRAQTVEDGAPRDQPFRTLHDEGTDHEYVRVSMTVRAPYSQCIEARRLVLRAYQFDGAVTVALEAIRVEEKRGNDHDDDGA